MSPPKRKPTAPRSGSRGSQRKEEDDQSCACPSISPCRAQDAAAYTQRDIASKWGAQGTAAPILLGTVTCRPRGAGYSALGFAAAAPPSSVMNWRRLRSSMGSPPGTRCASLPQAQDAPEAPAGPLRFQRLPISRGSSTQHECDMDGCQRLNLPPARCD